MKTLAQLVAILIASILLGAVVEAMYPDGRWP